MVFSIYDTMLIDTFVLKNTFLENDKNDTRGS